MNAMPIHLLTISGSLRSGASNTALLDAARLVSPRGVEIESYDGLAGLPPFNPDLDTVDGQKLPSAAADLRARVGWADGLLISSPEYAHGIPGAFKNALDWLVGSVEFPGKPVALLSTSPRAIYVQAQLTEVLTTMNARIVAEASVTLSLPSRRHDAAAIAADPALSEVLRNAVTALVRDIAEHG